MRERRRTLRVAIGLAYVAASDPSSLTAQASQLSAEVGAARLRQRAIPSTDAVTAGLTLRHDAARYALAAAGGITLADDAGSTSQGVLAASVLGRRGGHTRWELGASVSAFNQDGLPLTAGAYLLAREHFALGRLGGYIGVGLGGIEEVDWWSPTRSAELSAWFTSRFARVTAGATYIDTRSEPYGTEGALVTDPVRYTDGSVGVRWIFRRRLDLDARGGMRFVSRGALTPTGRATRPFAAVDAAFWVTPQVAVAAGIGRHLADLSRGTPDTRFAALSLRFTVRAPGPASRPPHRLPGRDLPRLAVVGDTSGLPRLVVTSPRGAIVELAATFTSWEPVLLVRRGDRWELDQLISSGAHRVLVRIDGGPWMVPANLPAAADDFGGTVGILTVP